jgi:predicted  nucleic acid-binding Zn-ribbon protein
MATNAHLFRRVDNAKDNINSVIVELTDEIERLESENDELRKQIEGLENEVSELQDQIEN